MTTTASNHRSLAFAVSAIVGTTTLVLYYYYNKNKNSKQDDDEATPRDHDADLFVPVDTVVTSKDETNNRRILSPNTVTIVHGSMTGTCQKLAEQLSTALLSSSSQNTLAVHVGNVDDWDWWDELLNDDTNTNDSKQSSVLPTLVLLIPTYTNGSWSPASQAFKTALDEVQHDWRVEKSPLKHKLQVAVFGMGSSAYDNETFGKPAKQALVQLKQLGAKALLPVAVGDDATGTHTNLFESWMHDLIQHIIPDDLVEEPSDDDSDAAVPKEPAIMDLEDMGDSLLAAATNTQSAPREMVTPTQAAALKKEGYKLIGSHSAVKLCRWTKHQLRGRGGCYKHTFYGITSYQCMEATPSLACANKCVFCWRHHKNPVGKEWQWKTDDPNYIVEEAVQTHIRMIKETKGIPGVRMDRWTEAHTVRHCALSLVGEPIMYPRIDELLADLHRRRISSFLVTNGQHPQAIESLRPITQLYVSVDAPTPESLIAIDRPLFQDAWQRLQRSLAGLKDKGQRTVARLTVVKGWNSDEIAGYAQLIALGHVSLVEVKGVTYCGKSDASNLNMSNTPWHHEVVQLTKTLKEELDKLRAAGGSNPPPEYGLACEHKHSCSVLLARVDQFAVVDPVTNETTWRTWIDYDKFHELAARHAQDPTFAFTVEDYTAETPSWALFGAEEEGFDPTDTRHRKKQKHPKYTKFDDRGIPTHDHNNQELGEEERARLSKLMDERMAEIGSGSTVTELKDGAKEIQDASLMFRGMVIVK